MNDNTILRIKVPAHLYESVKEQLTLSEAKKGTHNLGAGMEIVKEKKNKTPKDGMKKMHSMNEMDKVEEGLVDDLGKFFTKVASDIKRGLGSACLAEYHAAVKAGKTHNEALKVYDACLVRTQGSKSVTKRVVGIAEKKERTMDELKKAKDMLEMKIKKMEESLNEKKHEEEGE